MTLPGWHHSEASASEKQSSQRANTHISAPRVQNSSHTSLAAIKIKFPFPPTTLYSPFFPSLCCCGPFHSHVFCVNPSPVFIPICFFFLSPFLSSSLSARQRHSTTSLYLSPPHLSRPNRWHFAARWWSVPSKKIKIKIIRGDIRLLCAASMLYQ